MRFKLMRWLCPPEYKIVPKTPTPDMLKAAAKAMSPGKRPTKEWVSCRRKHEIRYQAMIDAYDVSGRG